MSTSVNITTPVGRIVNGSLYKANDKDIDGKPLVIKHGTNAGQPRVQFYFGLAIPKGAEQGWWETEWGKIIHQVGAAAFPQACQRPDFAWKITDGDSTIPNKRGTKPVDMEGFKGNWILKLSGGYAPKVVKIEGGAYVTIVESDVVKPGYYVQAALTVAGNQSQQTPGIYLNHQQVLFRGFGPEIVTGSSAEDAFGTPAQTVALPAGASAMPLAVTTIPSPTQGPGAMPAALPSVPSPTGVPSAPTLGTTAVVMPNPQFLQGPSPVASVGLAGVPAAPQASIPLLPATSLSKMTPAANGFTYEQMIANGWTDATLIARGMMTP